MSCGLRCSLFRKDSNTWLYWCLKWSNVGGKKTVLTNASPCLVKLHLTHSQQDLFAQLCANIVMVLAVSAVPVLFSHSHYSAITKDLVSITQGRPFQKSMIYFLKKWGHLAIYIWALRPAKSEYRAVLFKTGHITQNPPKNNWFTQHNIGKSRVG